MRSQYLTLLGLSAAVSCAPPPGSMYEKIWDLLPRQASGNVTCPPTPNPMPKVGDLPAVKRLLAQARPYDNGGPAASVFLLNATMEAWAKQDKPGSLLEEAISHFEHFYEDFYKPREDQFM